VNSDEEGKEDEGKEDEGKEDEGKEDEGEEDIWELYHRRSRGDFLIQGSVV
jgi:hypothetical protein